MLYPSQERCKRGVGKEQEISQVPIIASSCSRSVSLMRNPTHIYISIYATQPMNEHHSFQPPDLENVISSTISSNVFEYIYTHSHARNDTREMMAKQPEKATPTLNHT